MDDGKLSQEEIDALLKVGADDDEMDNYGTNAPNSADYLSTIEKDTLGEIGNISFGSSATTLSTLLNQKVDITTPEISIMTKADFANEFDFERVSIYVNYIEGFDGQNVFVMKSEDAAIISDIMLGGDGTSPDQELGEIHLSALQEAMNQMMGTAATSMSTVFEKRVDISPPTIKLEKPDSANTAETISEDGYMVKVSFHLRVGSLIDSHIMQVLPIPFAKQFVAQLMKASSSDGQKDAAATVELDRPQEQTNQEQRTAHTENPQYLGDHVSQNTSSIQQATFSDLEQVALNSNEKRNLDMLLDIPLNVSVELGRTKRTVKDILDLSAGSVVELDKLAGEPVDILVNEKLIAKGEVVVIDENFGVRVTDITSQSDRLMKLK